MMNNYSQSIIIIHCRTRPVKPGAGDKINAGEIPMAFALYNFGCRANQADGEALAQRLESEGLAAPGRLAVVNTCAVTAEAEAEARRQIRQLGRAGARVLVTGCYAQRAPEQLMRLPGVEWVIGNAEKADIPKILRAAGIFSSTPVNPAPAAAASARFANPEWLLPIHSGAQTRPVLKVQEGCGQGCAFCIIPSTRGRSRSLPLEEVVDHLERLVAEGAREAVLSGIHLGHWGRDLEPRRTPAELVEAILQQTRIEQLRLSSIEPMDWSSRLIELLAHPRVAPHAHVPLQSGSRSVLRRMRRRYRPQDYAQKIEAIHAAAPAAAIGADVMAGFPGESAAEFEENHRFIEQLPLSYLHVFPFSERPGTEAEAGLQTGQWPAVPEAEKQARADRLRALGQQKQAAFAARFQGRPLRCLTLKGGAAGTTQALSGNYLKIEVAGDYAANQWLMVTAKTTAEGKLRGMAREINAGQPPV